MPRKTPEAAAPKKTKKKKGVKPEPTLSMDEVRERASFLAATGTEIRKVVQFNVNRWGVYTDQGLTCGRTRELAIENAIRCISGR